MKELMRTIKQTFYLNGKSNIFYMLAALGGAVFGIALVLFIMAADGTGEDYGMLGTIMALLVGTLLLLIGEVFSMQSEFNVAISMGKTRKYFLPAKYLNLVVNVFVLEIVVVLVSRLEHILYQAIYPGAVCELGVDKFTGNFGLLAVLAVCVPVVILFLGAMLMRFTAKFFWVIWALWMFGCMGVPRLIHAGKIPTQINIPEVYVVLIAVVILAVLTGTTIVLIRKQRVTA